MEVAKWSRDKKRRYQLEGFVYLACEHVDLSGAPVCRQCAEKRNRGSLPVQKAVLVREVAKVG